MTHGCLYNRAQSVEAASPWVPVCWLALGEWWHRGDDPKSVASASGPAGNNIEQRSCDWMHTVVGWLGVGGYS